jgi:glutamyl-tRNA synthetase
MSPLEHSAPRELVGRLAPSPTGELHLGHARSFLLAWWSVRSRGGRIGLRIEDLDAARSRPELADGVLRDLEWLGLDWDGPPRRSASETTALERACAWLVESGQAYPCVCTRAEVAALSAPHAGEGESRYPGTCRGRWRTLEEARAASGRQAGLRLLVDPGLVSVNDRLHGEVAFDVDAEVGDFLVRRRDGGFAYQLAIVVDDATDGVTEVLRGDDLLPSAARQALVMRALGLPRPEWIHVPLVLDEHGERLAKRRGSFALARLREAGADARATVAWAARSAGLDVPERCTPREALAAFDLARLPRSPVLLRDAELQTLIAARP